MLWLTLYQLYFRWATYDSEKYKCSHENTQTDNLHTILTFFQSVFVTA